MSRLQWAAGLGPDWEKLLYDAADRAIATNSCVRVGDFALVPDIWLAEVAANRAEVPQTWRLERHDGRSVGIFQLPAEGRP